MHIIVTSANPVKMQAVRNAIEQMFPDQDCSFESIAAPSGVADQPLSDSETLQGAINRVEYAKHHHPDADLWIGLEGGMEIDDAGQGWSFARMVVASSEMISKSKTALVPQPPKITQLVQSGMELGHADDLIFGQHNSKQQMGSVGLLTDGIIDRARFYEQAMIFALIPHKKTELYQE